jgi:ABC-type nickel/cobalt efflux system permease component RcnA
MPMNARTKPRYTLPCCSCLLIALLILLALPGTAAGQEPPHESATAGRTHELPVYENSAPATGAGRALSRLEERVDSRLAAYLESLSAGASLAVWVLVGLFSLLFGIIHAALPGHRKLLLFSYFLAEDARPVQGVIGGVAVAVLQVLSTVVLVLIGGAAADAATGSALENAAPSMQRVTGVAMAAVACVILVLRLIELLRTREDWRAQYFISQLSSVDSRIDPDNEDPALHLAVAHARRLRRRRRSDAPWLPAVILAGIVPCPATALVLSRSVALGVPLGGLLALVGLTLGVAVVLSLLSVVTVVLKERGIDMLGGRAGHFTHLGVEMAGSLLMLAFGLLVVMRAAG